MVCFARNIYLADMHDEFVKASNTGYLPQKGTAVDILL